MDEIASILEENSFPELSSIQAQEFLKLGERIDKIKAERKIVCQMKLEIHLRKQYLNYKSN